LAASLCSATVIKIFTVEQVLLATGGGNLVYIEIGQGSLVEVAHVQLEYEISCLDINPVGDNPERSNLVAVGMWTDISVRIFALPSLTLITKEMLGGEIIPRSVLFCSFDGVRSILHYVRLFFHRADVVIGVLAILRLCESTTDSTLTRHVPSSIVIIHEGCSAV
jgi:hypothetical protein